MYKHWSTRTQYATNHTLYVLRDAQYINVCVPVFCTYKTATDFIFTEHDMCDDDGGGGGGARTRHEYPIISGNNMARIDMFAYIYVKTSYVRPLLHRK